MPDALFVKAHHAGRAYVFSGLDVSAFFMALASCGAMFTAHLDQLLQMGCDEVKMIEGKPDMRKMLSIPPFDSPAYAPEGSVHLQQVQVPKPSRHLWCFHNLV